MKNRKNVSGFLFRRLLIVIMIGMLLCASFTASGMTAENKGYEATYDNAGEKILTREHIGELRKGVLFNSDITQRVLFCSIINRIQCDGEITEAEINELGENLFDKGFKVYLFSDVYSFGDRWLFSFPYLLSNFFEEGRWDNKTAVIVYSLGSILILDCYETITNGFLILGFSGTMNNRILANGGQYSTIHHIEGSAMLTMDT